jgi:hypothetical protein
MSHAGFFFPQNKSIKGFETRVMALQNTTTRKTQPLPGTYKLQWSFISVVYLTKSQHIAC